MAISKTVQPLTVQPISTENFQPYGQVIWATQDGDLFGAQDAQLELSQGTPRFYIMRLHQRGYQFHRITRHLRCTQCLGAMEGKNWLMAVSPPQDLERSDAKPSLEAIQAFLIPGNCFVKLHVGTWHAGPYFDDESVDFFNLELSDTNITDHHTCDLLQTYGVEMIFNRNG
jgi:ureidoglycolate hydrolase